MIKLVAIDVDDTLVDDSLQISPQDKQAVQEVRQQGVRVVLATGRMFVSALPFARELELPDDCPLIAYNGGLVKTPSGKTLHEVAIDYQLAFDVIKLCEEEGWTLNVYTDDQLFVKEHNNNVEYYVELARVPAQAVGALQPFLAQRKSTVHKLLIVGSEAEIAERLPFVQEKFGARAQVVRSKKRYIEITDPQANKGLALSFLASYYGLSPAQVMAIGDSGNDVSMLEFAGTSAAMGNAAQEVKRLASFSVGSCTENGVSEALHKAILNG